MALSAVKICNMALDKIGANRISSLSDTDRTSVLCNDVYERARDELLYSHPWNFAITRASLSADAATPDWEYSNQYTLPNDCLRVIRLEYTNYDYRVEGRKIVTDQGAPLKIIYIKQETDVTVFTPGFTELLALKIAIDLGYNFTANASLIQGLIDQFRRKKAEVKQHDAQEGNPRELEADTWSSGRFGEVPYEWWDWD